MGAPNCSYKKFIDVHRSRVREPWIFELFSHPAFHGVETALWPSLYNDKLCESFLQGRETRESGKVAFMTKVASAVLDYNVHYELLQYHYDRWLFKTITGAINSGKASNCSPAASLEKKTFSHQYWQNQHRYLIDAVRQFGYPSIFLTISPFEWTFPFPLWLSNLRDATGRGPTELAIPETLHIAHILEQFIRGFVCGKNSNQWSNHLFAKKSNPRENVTNYFYRYEFQKRGRLHTHILIWLDDICEVYLNKISATIPWARAQEAFEIFDLQSSRTTALPVRQAVTQVITQSQESHIAFHYTPTDKANNIRAYVPALIGSLHCSMDLQSSDGKGILLKYVSSCVAKCHDAVKTQELYSKDLGAYQAATTFLKTMFPLEPEMVLQLTSMKIAWTNSRTISFTAPTPDQTENKLYLKYLARPKEAEDLTLLQWLRAYDHEKTSPKRYKQGSTLVGVKTLSVFNPVFFYQVLVMNYPHRSNTEIRDQHEDRLPKPLKYFVSAVNKMPHVWSTREGVLEYFSTEAHKRHFLETIVYYVESLRDLYTIWKLGVINGSFASSQQQSFALKYPLSAQQTALHTRYVSLARQRQFEIFGRCRSVPTPKGGSLSSGAANDWRNYQLLLGTPGKGKTQVLKRLIHTLIEDGFQVTLCAPLAILATGYREEFEPDLPADTVHALFNIPVTKEQQYTVNYEVGNYDVVLLDKASMVAEDTFEKIHDTLQKQVPPPLLIVAGDECQQPPLKTRHGKTVQTSLILHNRALRSVSHVHTLYHQYRCTDKNSLEFLQYIRYSEPKQYVLDNFQKPLLLYQGHEISDEDIWSTLKDTPEATFLAVSQAAAARVNRVVMEKHFLHLTPFSAIPLDNDLEDFYAYKDLSVVVTQNLDKRTGVVNGQRASVVNSQGNTVTTFP